MRAQKTAWGVLALCVAVPVLGQYRNDRPIRGVWLRPPSSSVTSLEPHLQNFARAGVTDLYLETFYHGVSTGRQGVFNSRFGFDYLAAAINLAARYNVRVHAWTETGYWQYQTTGAYNFTNNPEWRVINVSTGTIGGDINQQVFANLGHPGVQAKLRSYATELAGYGALWSVQSDYHRMPIDNDTGDAYPSPWSYDTWSASSFATAVPGANILTQAAQSGQTHYSAFLTWRRNGISEAARQLYLGVQDGSNDVEMSAAVFATAMTSSSQVAKCQNWPAWCTGGYVDNVAPMAYGTSLTSIGNDLTAARNQAAGKKVLAGLAILSGRPAINDQMNTAKARSIEDFVLWEGSQLDTTKQGLLSNWITTIATPMRADLNANHILETGDYLQFLASYTGSPVTIASNSRLNWDGNTLLNTADHTALRRALSSYRLGPRGILSAADQAVFNIARTAAPAGGGVTVKNLFDYDQNGTVDDTDARWMEKLAWQGPMAFVTVSLQDTTVGPVGRVVRFEWVDATNTVLLAWNDVLDAQGKAIIPAFAAGPNRLRLKHGTWLRRAEAAAPSTNDQVLSLSLINGDVNDDNEIGSPDFALLAASFGTFAGNGGHNSRADLNQDGEVGPADFAILAGSFGEFGDE